MSTNNPCCMNNRVRSYLKNTNGKREMKLNEPIHRTVNYSLVDWLLCAVSGGLATILPCDPIHPLGVFKWKWSAEDSGCGSKVRSDPIT